MPAAVGLAFVIAAVLGAEPKLAAAGQAASGIEGEIRISPVCPVEHNPPLPQCAPRPYQASIVVKTADGQSQVAQFESDAQGHFHVSLDPGQYLLVPVNGRPYPRSAPQRVAVQEGKFTAVTVMYDSGMR